LKETVSPAQLDDAKIAEIVREVLVHEFEVDGEKVVAEAHLFKDLELDSLDGIDLIVALEKRFGVKVDEEAAKAFRHVKDVCSFIAKVRDEKLGKGRS
jgi:acyl carrier protein